MASEKVLVIPAYWVEGWDVLAPTGVMTDRPRVSLFLDDIIRSRHAFYMDRAMAEVDPSFKQVISYVVIRQGGMYYRYRRTSKGGESRLHGKCSIGIGGHINPEDGVCGEMGYEMGFKRELYEETGIEEPHLVFTSFRNILGLIYDKSTPVGSVHLGVVHLLDIPRNMNVENKDLAISQGHYASLKSLQEESSQFESWSQWTIDQLLPGLAN